MKFQPFEHYMLADDSKAYPMNFFMKFEFKGRLERKAFVAAVKIAMKHNPLMSSRMVGDPSKVTSSLEWIYDYNLEPAVLFLENEEAQKLFHQQIYLNEAAGFRLLVDDAGAKIVVYMQLHHAVADATAGVQFLESIMEAYGSKEDLTPLPAQMLEIQNKLLGRSIMKKGRNIFIRNILFNLQDIGRFFGFFPQPLIIGSERPNPKNYLRKAPAHVRKVFTVEEFDRIKGKAFRRGVSINDYFINELFMCLDNWNSRKKKKVHIRVAVPINMRAVVGQDVSSANIVSMVFINRTNARFKNPKEFQLSISKQMTTVKKKWLGMHMVAALSALGRVPSGITAVLKEVGPYQCKATAVLSNLGRVLDDSRLSKNDEGFVQARKLVLTGVELLPPVRNKTYCAFGVVTYNNKMVMTLHYDETRLTELEAHRLLGNFV